jgi:serine/threonine protein kinase
LPPPPPRHALCALLRARALFVPLATVAPPNQTNSPTTQPPPPPEKQQTTQHTKTQNSIYEKIGKGKHSVVYKGRKKKSVCYYAVKSVEKGQKARVLQEVRTMHALDHKHVLKFFAW